MYNLCIMVNHNSRLVVQEFEESTRMLKGSKQLFCFQLQFC